VAKELKAQGHDVIEFGAGEPDFNTPDNIKQAGINAIENNFTHYTPNLGFLDLREAISKKFKEENSLEYSPEQIIVSSGAKQSLFYAIMTLCEEGDEVIIPAPYWVTYPELVKMAGSTPVIVETTADTGFKMTATQLQENISPRTKLVMINSPNNPTGALYTESELRALAEICVKNNVYVISDEIYEKLIYDGEKHVSFASLGEDVKKLTITINGVSKAYAMTGWRIGYAAAEKSIIKAMSAFQSHASSAPASISQKASVEAIAGRQEAVEYMRNEFDKRRKYIVEKLNEIPGITCQIPKGAFYVFPEIKGLIGKTIAGVKIENDNVFAKLLLEQAHVVVVPGSSFGFPGALRLSYATSMEDIAKGIQRIHDFVVGRI
jgi:aspartate aminotransferase